MQDDQAKMATIETDWRSEVVWVCGPRLETDTRESWFARGAKRAGVQWRQLKALFHHEVVDPKFSIGERVKKAAAEARREALAHAMEMQSLIGRLTHTDPDFYGEEVDRLLHQINQIRGLDRT